MIRAVFFDAVGTLITPEPSPAEVYHAVGRRHGTRLPLGEIARRFVSAFRAEEVIDRENGWRTDEVREERRWRDIVAAVLEDVVDGEECFRELWLHFSRPDAWRCLAGVGPTLAALEARGLVLGVASNFDGRLRGVA